jgi:O-antigen/teichoic acid export membrane protein
MPAPPQTKDHIAQRSPPRRRSVRLNLAILAVGEMLTRGLSFLAFAYLARTLGADGFGKLEFVLSWIMLGQLLIESGFHTIGARDVAIDESVAPTLVARILPIQCGIALLSTLACYWFQTTHVLDDATSRLLFGYSLSLLALPWFLSWVFQGQQRMVWVTLPQVLRQLCFLVVVVALVRTAAEMIWLPYAEIASVLVAAALCLTVYLRSGQRLGVANPFAAPSRSLVRDASTIGTSQLLWFVRMYLPIVLLKFLLGDEAVGHFGAAHRIFNVFQMCVTVYWVNFLPELSRHAGRSTLQSTLLKSTGASTVVMILCAAGVTAFAPQIVHVIFGSGFSASTATAALAILIWRVPIMMFASHARQALFVMRSQGAELVCSLISVLILSAVAYFATVRYGVVGLATAATLAELAGAVATWFVWSVRWRLAMERFADEA